MTILVILDRVLVPLIIAGVLFLLGLTAWSRTFGRPWPSLLGTYTLPRRRRHRLPGLVFGRESVGVVTKQVFGGYLGLLLGGFGGSSGTRSSGGGSGLDAGGGKFGGGGASGQW